VTEELEVLTIVTGRLAAARALFDADFYVDRDAVHAAIEVRGVFNLIHHAYVIKVDCIVHRGVAGGLRGSGGPDHLQARLDAGHALGGSAGDVRNLLRSVPDLDRPYLDHWIARLGLGVLYREARGD
jgi:hypothetical protein